MYPGQLQERTQTAPHDALLDAIPDLELWLRGRAAVFHGEFEAVQLDRIRGLCAEIWPLDRARYEADIAVSIAALSTSLLDTLARHVRVGGAVIVLDKYTMSISESRFEAMVAPTALEIVRYALPHSFPVLRRGRRPVSCILRRRN